MSHTNKKKDAGEKRTTDGTYRNAEYLLKTTFSKHNKYVGFFLSLSILTISVSKNFEKEFLFTKNYFPFLSKVFGSTLAMLLYEAQHN